MVWFLGGSKFVFIYLFIFVICLCLFYFIFYFYNVLWRYFDIFKNFTDLAELFLISYSYDMWPAPS